MFPSLHGIVGQGAAVEVAPFAPSDLDDLALWLDADDAPTITEVSGAISQWADKSGNDWHATQGTAGNRPTLAASAIGGKPALRFDGSNDHLLLPTGAQGMFASLAGATFFAVASSSSEPGTVRSIIRVSNNFTQGITTSTREMLEVRVLSALNDLQALGRKSISVSTSSAVATGVPFAGPSVIGVRLLYNSAGSGGLTLRVDGQAIDTALWPTQAASDSGSDTLSQRVIGAAVTSPAGAITRHWLGDIAEILYYERYLDETEVGQVEAYLASKWGVSL